MDCPTCHDLQEQVARTSRDWAFAEQLAEVSRNLPEMAEPARRKAAASREEYELALHTLAEHKEQCLILRSRTSNGAGGVS